MAATAAPAISNNNNNATLQSPPTTIPVCYYRSFSSSSAATVVVDDDSFQQDPSVLKLKFKERLEEERQQALLGGGVARMERQHARGSLTARERLELLFDGGTFHELDQLKAHRCHEFGMDQKNYPGDGIITGYGQINGRFVYAFSQGQYKMS